AILFTDVVMPGATGSRELATRAHSLVPGLAVLFTSGYAQETAGWDDKLGHAPHLLQKPWRTDQLGQALQTALDLVQRPSAPPGPRRVLLVEDEGFVRGTTADVLTDMGFEVIEAETAASALARLDPAPDLVITDLG